jgi:hypothetical protein
MEIVWSTATCWIIVFLLMGMLEPLATKLFPILDIKMILQFCNVVSAPIWFRIWDFDNFGLAGSTTPKL